MAIKTAGDSCAVFWGWLNTNATTIIIIVIIIILGNTWSDVRGGQCVSCLNSVDVNLGLEMNFLLISKRCLFLSTKGSCCAVPVGVGVGVALQHAPLLLNQYGGVHAWGLFGHKWWTRR